MILAAHQPHFLPWLGYFDKMRRADLFVLVDHVQFERQNYQNRTRVKTGQGPAWITVPVLKGSRGDRLVDKLVDNSGSGRHWWGHRVGATLKHAYQGAPHFSEAAPPVLEILDVPWKRLTDLNRKLIDFCREALGIRTPMLRSSDMRIRGAKSDMVLNLCLETGSDAYLTGTGASRDYLDAAAFQEAGVRIIWQDFVHPRYPQHPSPDTFIEKMSVFDLLANCGPQSGSVLQGKPALEAVSP